MNVVAVAVLIVLGVFGLGGACMAYPQYRVYSQRAEGAARLAEAESSRKILVEQAKAEEESAQRRANAIKIVGQAAKDFPEYRYQEFLGAFAEALKEGKINQIIYVPTEANIPLMEAGKRYEEKK